MAGLELSLDADQQTSAVEKGSPQNDRWRSGEISTRREGAFTLVVIADGEGQTAPGEAAALAVETAFAEASLRGDEPLPKLLGQLLSQMNEVVFALGSRDMVGVTLAAIQGDGVWLVQAGSQTRCYRVRGERSASLLTGDNNLPLGAQQIMPPQATDTHRLRRGDKLVFCSDGLYTEDLVSPEEIAKIDRYREVKGAARHLSALAMGRNVRDNVTVVVAAYGRKSALTLKLLAYFLFASAAAVLIILMGGLSLQQFLRPIPRPPDYGVAVLAEGNAVQLETLDNIVPGTDVNAAPDSPIHLNIKRRESLEGRNTQNIPDIDLYFGPGTAFNLAAVDVQGFKDPARGIEQATDLAEISLTEGQALLLSQQAHTFYIWLGPSGKAGTPFAIIQGIPAAFGVERRGDQVHATCLAGSCSIRIGRESTRLPPGTRTSFTLNQTGKGTITTSPADPAEHEKWLSLCMTWQVDPESVPEACTILMP